MKQKRVTGDRQEMQRTSRKEPLTEGIQKKAPRPRYFFTKISDDELVSYAKKIIKKNTIKTRTSLAKEDKGLYNILRIRNLLDAVIPEKQHRNWSSMTNEKLISFTKNFMEKKGIKNRIDLQKTDGGLYEILRKRNLLDAVIPEKHHRNWSSMTNEKLISFTKNFMEKKGIKNRKSLEKADASLSQVLRKRNLLDAIIPEKQKHRDWSSMSDKELILFAKKFVEENKIKNRKELFRADGGLHQVLRRRNLYERVISEKRISRDWSSITVKELVSYAKTYIEENKIKNRNGLAKADYGLYQVLRKRNLLNAVFSDIEKAKKIEGIRQVVDAMKEF